VLLLITGLRQWDVALRGYAAMMAPELLADDFAESIELRTERLRAAESVIRDVFQSYIYTGPAFHVVYQELRRLQAR